MVFVLYINIWDSTNTNKMNSKTENKMEKKTMTKSTCIWKGCKETIKIDSSFEDSPTGQRLGISVVGWCDFHSKVYAKQTELFDKLSKDKHHSDIANDLYKNNRKKYNKIQRQAITIVKKEMKI